MKITEDLKKYLRNSFIDDVLSKINRPNIEMTSEYVWGKHIKLPFYHDGTYDTDTFELENWYVTIDLSQVDTIEELTNLATAQITEVENDRLYDADPFDERSDVVCHQLCDWRVLTDEDDNPLRGNTLTLVKYARFIDMEGYGLKDEECEGVNVPSLGHKLSVSETPIATESFSNPSLEEAYKQGIRDALDWLTDPSNQDTYSDEYGERIYYFMYEDEIDQFAREKGIECKTKLK